MTNLAELGPHNWQDYSDFWRESDAEWLQSRSILRVDTFANLATTVPSPGVGQLVHVKQVSTEQKDVLYLYSSTGSGKNPDVEGWSPYSPFPKFLYASEDTATRVTLAHHTGNPVGAPALLTLSTSGGVSVVSDFVVRGTVFKVTAADVSIRATGTKTVVLTTDTAGLVSDSPIKAPGLTLTGAFVATGQALSAATVTTTGNVTAAGEVSGNTLKSTTSVTSANYAISVGSTGGYQANKGYFWGDATGPTVRHADWVAGWASISTTGTASGIISLKGGASTDVDNRLRVLSSRSIEYVVGGTTRYGGPVIVSPTEPAGPVGTIWVVQ